jgi:hypothetical protein
MHKAATIAEFKDLSCKLWGTESRTQAQLHEANLAAIEDMVDFDRAPQELRVHIADVILRVSTPSCGSCGDNGDARWFLHRVGRSMRSGKGPFDGRRVPVLQTALMLLSHFSFVRVTPSETLGLEGDLSLILGRGGAALASIYLLSQLEYLFRVKGDYLDYDGVLQKPVPAPLNGPQGIRVNVGSRVNQIQHAFSLYLHGNNDPLAIRLAQLDKDIKVGDRLAHFRSPVMHGPLGDASVEGFFYGLLVSMFYNSET